jgi:spermidine synthase
VSTTNESSLWIHSYVDGLAGISIKARHALLCEASPFQKVEVFDTYRFGRVLMLAGTIVLTETDEFIYHETMVHPAMLMAPQPSRVCIIGGGDGGALREVLKYGAVQQVTVVEIDKLVVKAVREHFPSLAQGFGDTRTELVIDDGHGYLTTTQQRFDTIIVDSYDPGGPVQSLTTEDFYHLVDQRLTDQGVAVFQTDSPTLNPECIRHTIRNVSALFAEIRPCICTVPSFPEATCSFLVCAKTRGGLDTFHAQRLAEIGENCRYYNEETHRGAFALPRYIKETVGSW